MTLRIIHGEPVEMHPGVVMGPEMLFPHQRNRRDFPYIYAWKRLDWTGRHYKGERCRLLARGKFNSCLLEFEDGFKVITSRNALRKFKPYE